MSFLSEEFLEKYKKLKPKFTELGEFVYLRTYSRYLEKEKRRETWLETCVRVAEYSVGIIEKKYSFTKEELIKEAENIFDNMFNLRTFPSGRTMWIGNTKISEKCKLANFNCAFTSIKSFYDFIELFYLSMVGSGTGFSVFKEDVEKLPKIRTDVSLISGNYSKISKNLRLEHTNLIIKNNVAILIVGDSKEGWIESLKYYFDLLTKFNYKDISTIMINYDNIREKGEKLKTFGGRASGYKSLRKMFNKIHYIVKKSQGKLKTIDVLDIANIIGENVVSGGVRRTAQIALFDSDDDEILDAKSNLYYKDKDGNFVENEMISHRKMSNNSIFFNEKPSREKLHDILERIKISGEPGFINGEAGRKRRSDFKGMNPCGEILLDDKESCNLTTTNLMAFVNDDKSLDIESLYDVIRLSTRIGIRMTIPELELEEWDKKLKRDRLIGVSLTGFQDMVNETKMDIEGQRLFLRKLRKVVHDEAKKYSKRLGINEPLLKTTIKPEGTISQLRTVSSGVHFSHSEYYIRRVRISATDPLCKVVEELGYPIYPEVGQTEENCSTKVVEFPIKAPKGKTKYDVSAIEQLEIYKMFMEEWTDHNTSITVHVKPYEWMWVEEWLWNNWDSVVGVSFLSLDNNFYPLLPYESISESEYLKRKSEMKPFNADLLKKYEAEEVELDVGTESCESGVCPIR